MSFKCPYCDYQSLRSDSILNHLQSVHSNEISEEEINSLIGRKKCPDCGKYVYERYMRKGKCKDCAGKGEGQQCPICGKFRKNLRQHLNRAHKDLSKEEYCKISGMDKTCPICGKLALSTDFTHRGLCDTCFEKYHVKCHICGFPIVWSPGDHYGKAHNTEPPNLDIYGTLQEWFCISCGVSLGFKRVLNRNKCNPMDKVCDKCKKEALICPSCGKPILRSKNLLSHLFQCRDNSEESAFLYIKNLPDIEAKKVLLQEWDKYLEQSRRANEIASENRTGKTFDEIYGVEKSKEIRSKISNTMIENGTGFSFWKLYSDEQKQDLIGRQKSIKFSKYGSKLCSKEALDRMSKRMKENNPAHDPKVLEKIKQTLLSKYGVDNIAFIQAQKKYLSDRTYRSSKVANRFFSDLDIRLGLSDSIYGENELCFLDNDLKVTTTGILFLDYYNPSLGLAIEFFGDYWHCSPLKYKPDDIVYSNKKVSDIWERDSLRCQIILEQLNPKYFYIVWESDKDRMMEVITNEVINARTLE